MYIIKNNFFFNESPLFSSWSKNLENRSSFIRTLLKNKNAFKLMISQNEKKVAPMLVLIWSMALKSYFSTSCHFYYASQSLVARASTQLSSMWTHFIWCCPRSWSQFVKCLLQNLWCFHIAVIKLQAVGLQSIKFNCLIILRSGHCLPNAVHYIL